MYLRSYFFLCIIYCVLASGVNSEYDHLKSTSIVYGLGVTALESGHRSEETERRHSLCYKELGDITEALRNNTRWAVLDSLSLNDILTILEEEKSEKEVHDASGTPSTGLMWRGTFWLGSRSQCRFYNKQIPLNVSPFIIPKRNDSEPPFKLAYFVVYATHNSSVQQKIDWWNENLITIGLCLPVSCSSSELTPLLDKYFESFPLASQRMYEMNLKVEKIKITEKDDSYKQTTMYAALMYTCAIVAILSIIGTAYDKFVVEKRVNSTDANRMLTSEGNQYAGNTVTSKTDSTMNKKYESECNNNNLRYKSESGNGYNAENVNTLDKQDNDENKIKSDVNDNVKDKIHVNSNKMEDIIMCFSVRKNFDKIIDTKPEKDMLLAINGWRVLITGLTVFLHNILFNNDKNASIVAFHYRDPAEPKYFEQAVSNGHFVVDSFLCLGGFLVGRAFLKSNDVRIMKEKPSVEQSAKNWISGIWKRYLRLSPPHMFTILVSTVMYSKYLSTSVISLSEKISSNCPNFWWTNLLYINNIYPRTANKCLVWTYYLSNDMQFYIVGNLLLYMSIYAPIVAGLLGFGLVGISLTLTVFNVYVMDYYPYMHMLNRALDVLYMPFWMRITPHLTGIFGAYMLHYHKDVLTNNKVLRYLGWTLTTLGGLYALYGTLDIHSMTLWQSAFYTATCRPLWGLFTLWFFMQLVTNNIWSPVNKFLSLRMWIPLSRLCYCAYLINATIIYQGILKAEKHMFFEEDGMLMAGGGMILITFFIAFFVALFIETPTNNLVTVLSKKRNHKAEKPPHNISVKSDACLSSPSIIDSNFTQKKVN